MWDARMGTSGCGLHLAVVEGGDPVRCACICFQRCGALYTL